MSQILGIKVFIIRYLFEKILSPIMPIIIIVVIEKVNLKVNQQRMGAVKS